MIWVGIDPGVSGGISAICEKGVLLACKMPETDRDILDALRSIKAYQEAEGPAVAMLEQVNAGVFGRPGQKMGVVSAFTFGGGYRALQMALTACEIPFDLVMPIKWQTALGCRSRGDKSVTKRRAQQLFPSVKMTHALADSLLIAEYCQRVRSSR